MSRSILMLLNFSTLSTGDSIFLLIWPVETDPSKANSLESMFNPPPISVAGHVEPNDELHLDRLVDSRLETQ